MSNQPDVIEKYLDQICGYLQMMPEDDVAEIRRELREHLRLSVDELVASGVTADLAPGEATRRFGRARRVGLDIAMKSPYAWMWTRSVDDEITLGVVPLKSLYIGLFAPQVIIVLVIGVISHCLHHQLAVPLWCVILSCIPSLIAGFCIGITGTIRNASKGDFNKVSRKIAVAVRSFDANHLPRWQRRLNLHRLFLAMRVALPLVDMKVMVRQMWLTVVCACAQVGFARFSYLNSERHNGDFFWLLNPMTFLGLPLGGLAFHVYLCYRRRLMTAEGGKADVEPA